MADIDTSKASSTGFQPFRWTSDGVRERLGSSVSDTLEHLEDITRGNALLLQILESCELEEGGDGRPVLDSVHRGEVRRYLISVNEMVATGLEHQRDSRERWAEQLRSQATEMADIDARR